jgi:hypothetical protein
MNNEELRDALVWLYAVDCELATPAGTEPSLRVDCRQAVWDRLVGNETELRVWISRLVRDVFLSEGALANGHGIDDACEFWSWFDQSMWMAGASRPPAELSDPICPSRLEYSGVRIRSGPHAGTAACASPSPAADLF